MKADQRFLNQPLDFWANIKLISQKAGYTDRKTKQIKVHTLEEIREVYESNNLDCSKVIEKGNRFTALGALMVSYFQYRSDILQKQVEPNLMNLSDAKKTFEELHEKLKPTCPLPRNKQKGDKAGYAYLTGIVNMLIENNSEGFDCNYNPNELTAFTKNKFPVRTLSRRVDGAFPGVINPVAIWEIKEYYFTTTFGSRVADGIYETWLDGLELREVKENLKIHVEHFLIVDDHFTWWMKGRSYLCRIIDMLHMGILTQALFGKEVVKELPTIVKGWTNQIRPTS
ncbi:MAG: hypothetical protein ACKVOU_13975 [Cytophagales bacterium]